MALSEIGTRIVFHAFFPRWCARVLAIAEMAAEYDCRGEVAKHPVPGLIVSSLVHGYATDTTHLYVSVGRSNREY